MCVLCSSEVVEALRLGARNAALNHEGCLCIVTKLPRLRYSYCVLFDLISLTRFLLNDGMGIQGFCFFQQALQ